MTETSFSSGESGSHSESEPLQFDAFVRDLNKLRRDHGRNLAVRDVRMELNSVTQAQFVLVIERGRSRYPQRPLTEDRFLIGAGSNCHLQLGGEMPILHSIIIREADHLWIDALVQDPPLLVNGQRVREGELKRGDVIEIGSFVFSVTRTDLPVSAPSQIESSESEAEESPAELVQHLVEELGALQDLERRRIQGANALLEVASRLNDVGPSVSTPSDEEKLERISASTTPQSTLGLSISQLELMEQLGIDSVSATHETEGALKRTA